MQTRDDGHERWDDAKEARRGPTLRILQRVIAKTCTLQPLDRLIAIAIAEHVNREGEAWPSIRRLVEITGIKRSRLVEGLKTLTDGPDMLFYKDWRRSKTKGHRSVTYVFVESPAGLARARAKGHHVATNPVRQEDGATTRHHQESGASTWTDEATTRHSTGHQVDRQVPPRGNKPPSEPLIEPEREPPRARGRAGAALPPSGATAEPEPDRDVKAAIVALARTAEGPRRRMSPVEAEAYSAGLTQIKALLSRDGKP